jgi:hypothetical protein
MGGRDGGGDFRRGQDEWCSRTDSPLHLPQSHLVIALPPPAVVYTRDASRNPAHTRSCPLSAAAPGSERHHLGIGSSCHPSCSRRGFQSLMNIRCGLGIGDGRALDSCGQCVRLIMRLNPDLGAFVVRRSRPPGRLWSRRANFKSCAKAPLDLTTNHVVAHSPRRLLPSHLSGRFEVATTAGPIFL